jgi:FtsH-binding integral membrane protein
MKMSYGAVEYKRMDANGGLVGPNAQNSLVIPPRIWKQFLMGTYSWMVGSILFMILAIAAAVYYTIQTDSSSRAIVGVNYAVTIMTIYWLSANIRDAYRYRVLETDPDLNERTKRNLGGPSARIRCLRILFSVLGVIGAIVIFAISLVQSTTDKLTGCVIELLVAAATAVLAKTAQDREDGEFLASFDTPRYAAIAER